MTAWSALYFKASGGRFEVRLEPSAVRQMLDHCQQGGSLETGGILVGNYSADRKVAVIHTVSGKTSDSRARQRSFVRGVFGLHAWLSKLWQQRSGHYVGEWHFHPHATPTPSEQDIQTMQRIARTSEYECCEPVLVIVGGDPAKQWKVHVEINTREGVRHVLVHDPIASKAFPAVEPTTAQR